MNERPITYWPATPTPIAHEPRWAIGRYGPRIIAQCSEADAQIIVAAFQRLLDAGTLPPFGTDTPLGLCDNCGSSQAPTERFYSETTGEIRDLCANCQKDNDQ